MYNQPGTNDSSQIANNDTARTDQGVPGAWTSPECRPVTTAAQTMTANETAGGRKEQDRQFRP